MAVNAVQWSLVLDIKKVLIQPIPQYTDGDTNLLTMYIKDNGADYDLSEIDRGILNIKVSDGTIVGGIVTVNANSITYEFGSEAQTAGEAECKLMLYDDNDVERISTLPFKVVFGENWVATDPSNPSQDIATTMLQELAALDQRIDDLEAGIGTPHSHDNKTTLDKIAYTGASPAVDLIQIEQNTAAISGKADADHDHAIADVTGLQTALDGKADDGHTHLMADVTDLQAALDGKSDVGHNHDLDYADINHNHDGIYEPVGLGATVATHTEQITNILAAGEPTGFVDRTTSTISFVNANRQFTIAPTGANFTIYQNGVKYVLTSQSIQIPDTTGVHFIYFDNGVLATTPTFSEAIITQYVYVANVYWNSTNDYHVLLGDERHGMVMDARTHSYLHNTVGTAYVSGLALGNFILDGTGANASDAQFNVNSGQYRDEDITFLPATTVATNGLPVFYLTGATPEWNKGGFAGFPVHVTGTGRLAYNQFTGGAWQLTEVTNGQYVLYHVFATNDTAQPFVTVMGQASYTSVANARAGANVEINSLITTGMPFQEFIPVGTVIYQTDNAYTNVVNARVRSTDTGGAYVDWRLSGLSPTVASATAHNNLTDRNAPNAHPASAITYTPTTLAATDVQAAITELAAEKTDVGHTHAQSDVTNLVTDLAAIVADVTTLEGQVANTFVGSNVRGSQYVTAVNDIVKSGWYYSVDTANNPVANNGFVWHNQFSELDTYASQIFQEFSNNDLYTRRKVAGVWQAWVKFSYTNTVKYRTSSFTASSSGASTFAVGVTYNVATDAIHVHINGLKLTKGTHYTATSTTVTLLNGFTLTTSDDVLVEVMANTL